MDKEHLVIVVPGLGDRVGGLELVTKGWKEFGLTLVIHPIGWRDGEGFETKFSELIRLIDELAKHSRVDIVGTSAGGCAALNAFSERNQVVGRAVNVWGRLRTGPIDGFRGFAARTAISPAFVQAVKMWERRESGLITSQRKRIMTVRGVFDELVPPETVSIEGAKNVVLPWIEHNSGIALTLSLWSKLVIDFLKEKV